MPKKNKQKPPGEDQPIPLLNSEWAETVPPRDPLTGAPNVPVEFRLLVAAESSPEVEVSRNQLENGLSSVAGQSVYALKFSVAPVTLGSYALPPPVQTRRFTSAKIKDPERQFPTSEPRLPDHLALRTSPQLPPKELRAKPRIIRGDPKRPKENVWDGTVIFPPDDRRVFQDASYPWSTVGVVDTIAGPATGVMIGPSHVLTVSHAVQWQSANMAWGMSFTPALFDTSMPFGTAWSNFVYYEMKVDNSNGLDINEVLHDFVVIILDRRLGDLTGWMGARTWTDFWNNQPYWAHVGYPTDLGGTRPAFQNNISMISQWMGQLEHRLISHQADVFGGQSGGPFFGWWAGDPGPSVVATQSAEHPPTENGATGGSSMVQMILQARQDFP